MWGIGGVLLLNEKEDFGDKWEKGLGKEGMMDLVKEKGIGVLDRGSGVRGLEENGWDK